MPSSASCARRRRRCAHAEEIRAAIRAKNPQAEIRFIDTICHPTKDHQKALERLMDEVEAMVVVGGHNSNNTRQLVLRCQAQACPPIMSRAPRICVPNGSTASKPSA